MGARIASLVTALALLATPAALAQEPPAGPYAPWDGSNPFKCQLQDVGTGTEFPDPAADPFCVEFDKNSQNLTEFGLVDFLSKEPARVGAAVNKCFYFQSDHWTGWVVQGEPPELWHWDGQYFFDKAIGAGGVNLQNFRVLGQAASLADYMPVPAEFAPYFDQGGGGAYVAGDIPADPACAARIDTPEERAKVYAGSPPPSPLGESAAGGRCDLRHLLTGSESDDELIGGPGGDVIDGRGGNDLLKGAEHGDCLNGMTGNDRLKGGPGRDTLRGGAGDDLLRGGRGRNTLRCGKGTDTAYAGPRDKTRGCESVHRAKR